MKRSFVAFFVLILALTMATMVSAQTNKLAFFDIDAEIQTEGFQGGNSVGGIESGKRVGFALYVKNVDQLRGYQVKFSWDGTLAEMTSDSGSSIDLDDRNVNNEDVTLSEDNAVGDLSSLGEVSGDGSYEITFSKLGGDALSSTDYGLVYLFVLKTSDTFTADTALRVQAEVTALNDAGTQKSLGTRSFYINGGVDVKTSSWGEIKSQFKD